MSRGRIRKTLRHALEFGAVLCFYAVIRITPSFLRRRLPRLLGNIAFTFTPRRVGIAMENLKAVLPHYSQPQLRAVVRNVYCNLAANGVDAVRPELNVIRVNVDAAERAKLQLLKEVYQKGKPIIFVTGHYGAWEVLGQYLATLFPRMNFLAKAQANKLVDNFINRLRVSLGGRIIPSHLAPRMLPKVLKAGECIAVVGDQDAGTEGTVIDFLGRPASYFRGMALFAYHYDAPIVIIFLARTGDGYALSIRDIAEPDCKASREEEILRLLTRYSDKLGEVVRENPDQWLWTHRRWKSTINMK